MCPNAPKKILVSISRSRFFLLTGDECNIVNRKLNEILLLHVHAGNGFEEIRFTIFSYMLKFAKMTIKMIKIWANPAENRS